MIAATGKPKSGWKEYSLLDLCEIQDTMRIPLSSTERAKIKGTFPYYGASGIVDYINNYIFSCDTVLVSEDGENLNSRKTPIAFRGKDKYWVNNHAHVLLPKNKYYFPIVINYLNAMDLSEHITGAVQPKLTQENLAKIRIKLPIKEEEQRAIAILLSSLDDKIDLLHRQNKTLEGLASALWRKTFIEEPKSDWKEKGLDEIATFLNGLPCQKYPPNAMAPALPVIKIKELRAGITADSDQATSKVPTEYIISEGDILFSWSGSLEIVIWAFAQGVLNQHLFKVTSDIYPKWFYYHWIRHHLPDFRDITEDKATTMGHIQRHHLSDAKVLVPDSDSLDALSSQFEPLFEKTVQNLENIRSLSLMRDALLPKLMSGEVRVTA